MPKVSINILTKNRAELLKKALASVGRQTFKDFEVVLVSDGSTDDTEETVREFTRNGLSVNFCVHSQSLGIVTSRQEALEKSAGEYIAILDDDDEWIDRDKLKKQAEFLDAHRECVIAGGGILISNIQYPISKFRPESDWQIRQTMLFRNNFFTSTVMFRKKEAVLAGGFISDGEDLAEDYDLWLRMGRLGKMYNFREVFTLYRRTQYNKERFQLFLSKQLKLIGRYRRFYPFYNIAAFVLRFRLKFLTPNS